MQDNAEQETSSDPGGESHRVRRGCAGKLNADAVGIPIVDQGAAQLAQDPLYARIAELEMGLRVACDHIDDLHLLDLGLRAESVRLRALAGKP